VNQPYRQGPPHPFWEDLLANRAGTLGPRQHAQFEQRTRGLEQACHEHEFLRRAQEPEIARLERALQRGTVETVDGRVLFTRQALLPFRKGPVADTYVARSEDDTEPYVIPRGLDILPGRYRLYVCPDIGEVVNVETLDGSGRIEASEHRTEYRSTLNRGFGIGAPDLVRNRQGRIGPGQWKLRASAIGHRLALGCAMLGLVVGLIVAWPHAQDQPSFNPLLAIIVSLGLVLCGLWIAARSLYSLLRGTKVDALDGLVCPRAEMGHEGMTSYHLEVAGETLDAGHLRRRGTMNRMLRTRHHRMYVTTYGRIVVGAELLEGDGELA